MKYRGEIDGLRALAVLPVILFHAGFEMFSGGFVGVDVFFVISGYLITTILIEDIENNRFCLVNFYERRARRILPALILVVLVSTVFAWIILGAVSLNKYGNTLIGIGLFVSNIIFWRQQGYFEESAELNPLLHTWSLAVEEQYYLMFPIFLLLTWRFGKNRVFWMIVVLSLISLLVSEWGWRNHAKANFYLAPTRAWELFAGSIAAFFVQKRGVLKNNVLSLLGITAIFFAIFAYDKTTPFPSLYALMPVLGVVLIILFGNEETIVAKILSTKILVRLGLISYSSYLWHQPLFAYTRRAKGNLDLQIITDFVLIFITFVIAYLSWRFIEKPFRNRNFLSTKTLFGLSFIMLIIVILLGISSKSVTRGNEYTLAKTLANNKFVYFENMSERKFIEGRLMFNLKKVDHVLVGSSRIKEINSEMIGEPILNLWVSGASVEDDLAFLLEAAAKLSPKTVYIAADPWLLNKFDRQNRYQSVDELYQYWLAKLDTGDDDLKPFYENSAKDKHKKIEFTFLHKLIQSIKFKGLSIATNNEIEAVAKISYDGSHIYNEAKINNMSDISEEFDMLLNYGMKEFSYDKRAEIILVKLISFLSIKGFDVKLILSPYHPELYKRMKLEKPIFIKLEKKFRRIANENNISIIGSYDPSIVGCIEKEFYDGMHPTGICMSKAMNVRTTNE